jgi:hypothetical protein
MAEEKLRPVIGRYKPPERSRISHTDGWNRAIEKALSRQRFGWPAGVHENVRVEFSATVEVYNPGGIIEYAVAFIPQGHGGGH